MIFHLHDTHFHLDLCDEPRKILREIEHNMVYTIAVTNVPEVFYFTKELVKESRYVRAALGFHPELAYKHKSQLRLFNDLLNESRYIGEIGLDNYNKTAEDYLEQKNIFNRIISSCDEAKNKILTVHSRRSEGAVIDAIGSGFSGKVIMHWYSGSIKELERALLYGFYFSINYAMTKSDNGRKIIEAIPKDRILLETDGPFVKVLDQPATPLVTNMILNEIMVIKKREDFQSYVSQNLRTLLS